MTPDPRDATVERWLQDSVAPVYDAMKENPERKLSAKSVFAEVRARYAATRKAPPQGIGPWRSGRTR